MSDERKSTDTTAGTIATQADDEDRLFPDRLSITDIFSTGADPSPIGPPVETELTLADLVRWAEQMKI